MTFPGYGFLFTFSLETNGYFLKAINYGTLVG